MQEEVKKTIEDKIEEQKYSFLIRHNILGQLFCSFSYWEAPLKRGFPGYIYRRVSILWSLHF
jgi:hypothetical protein